MKMKKIQRSPRIINVEKQKYISNFVQLDTQKRTRKWNIPRIYCINDRNVQVKLPTINPVHEG